MTYRYSYTGQDENYDSVAHTKTPHKNKKNNMQKK